MRKVLAVAGIAAVVVAAAALAGVGLPEEAHGDAGVSRTVTVTGTGTVEARPDRAQLSFGVESRADAARAASTQNAQAMRRLIDALEQAGVAEDDLRTEHVSVWPVSDGSGPVSGYTASGSVSVEVAVDRAGRIVDVATANGATNVGGPMLTRSETNEAEEQALVRALADARRKAKALAAAAGADLGEVMKLVEGGSVEPMPYAARALDSAESSATPIEPGKIPTTASLTVTFVLR